MSLNGTPGYVVSGMGRGDLWNISIANNGGFANSSIRRAAEAFAGWIPAEVVDWKDATGPSCMATFRLRFENRIMFESAELCIYSTSDISGRGVTQ